MSHPPTSSRGQMSRIDIIDETFIRCDPLTVRTVFDDRGLLARVWPHLELDLVRDRGAKGCRWQVEGAVVGDMEVWIEPYWDGAIVHHYLRGVPSRGAPPDVATRHQLRWKRAIHGLKDSLEGASL
jgi:hypothetical protein